MHWLSGSKCHTDLLGCFKAFCGRIGWTIGPFDCIPLCESPCQILANRLYWVALHTAPKASPKAGDRLQNLENHSWVLLVLVIKLQSAWGCTMHWFDHLTIRRCFFDGSCLRMELWHLHRTCLSSKFPEVVQVVDLVTLAACFLNTSCWIPQTLFSWSEENLQVHFFSVDHEFIYEPFFADFGHLGTIFVRTYFFLS